MRSLPRAVSAWRRIHMRGYLRECAIISKISAAGKTAARRGFASVRAAWHAKQILKRVEVQMNWFAKLIVGSLLLILVAAEIYLFRTYWSAIMDASNFEKAGPIIQSLFTPLVAVVTVL